MSKISELFKQHFKTILINLTEEDILILLFDIHNGNWQPAYKKLIEKMSTAELCELQDAINEDFLQANARNATMVEIQERIIFGALEGWLLGYKAVV